jgi:hypothetical protein
MKVKKYIEIPEEVLVALAEGKYVEGSLHRDKDTCRIVFNVYNRKPRKRLRDIIIRYLEHGWVKESAERIKIYESIPKVLGTAHINGILDRDIKTAKDALITREIIERT